MEQIRNFGNLIDYIQTNLQLQTTKKDLMHLIFLGMKIQEAMNQFQKIDEGLNIVNKNIQISENQLSKGYDKELNFSYNWSQAIKNPENQLYIGRLTLKKYHSQIYTQDEPASIIKQNHYMKLSKSVPNSYDFQVSEVNVVTCIICQSHESKEFFILSRCRHQYHKICLEDSIKSTLKINCIQQQCGVEIEKEDLYKLINQETFERIQKYASFKYLIENKNKFFICPTPNCQGLYEIQIQSDQYKCYQCNQIFCSRCMNLSHTGECQKSQSFINFVKQNKLQQCQKCQNWVEKQYGCNHMVCQCSYEFCYNCGKQWKKNLECKCMSDYEVESEINQPSKIFLNINQRRNEQKQLLQNQVQLNQNTEQEDQLFAFIQQLEECSGYFKERKMKFYNDFWSQN